MTLGQKCNPLCGFLSYVLLKEFGLLGGIAIMCGHVGQTRRTKRAKRRGAAVVEFAVVAPVLLLFVLGIIEFGRMVMAQQLITNAAREGARIAIVPGSSTSQVTSKVSSYLSTASISGATTTVSPDPSAATYGSTVTVTVSLPFSSVAWSPPFFLGSKTLIANCAMRTEQSNSSGH